MCYSKPQKPGSSTEIQPKQKREIYVVGGKQPCDLVLHQARTKANAAARIDTNPSASGTWNLFAVLKIDGFEVDPAAAAVVVAPAAVNVGAVTPGTAAVLVVVAVAGAAGVFAAEEAPAAVRSELSNGRAEQIA
jgi:hypothetical protein